MTPKKHDQLVVLMAHNDQFIAEQYARVRVLTWLLLRAQRHQRQQQAQGTSTLECANLTDAISDLLRSERKGLRKARYVRWMGEGILTGRIPGSPN